MTNLLYLITLSDWGGAERYVFDLADFFNRQDNYQITVAMGGDPHGELIKKLSRLTVPYVYLPHLQRSLNFYNDFLAFWEIFKLYKKIKPDIIHLNSSKAGSLGALAAAFYNLLIRVHLCSHPHSSPSKIIYAVHGFVLNEPLSPPRKLFYWLAEKITARFKTHFVSVSNFDQTSLLKYKICPAEKITIIHNGLDLTQLFFYSREEARDRLQNLPSVKYQSTTVKFQSQDFFIATVANFYPVKGLTYLVEAARQVRDYLPHAKFFLIGEGQLRQKLEKMITAYKLENNFFLTGNLPNALEYLAAFDLFVLPSVKEGFAYALLEALSAGLPIVATDVGGNREIVTAGENGYLVPAKNFTALAENILNLLKNNSARQKFSDNNLKKIKQFSLEEMLSATKKIYES